MNLPLFRRSYSPSFGGKTRTAGIFRTDCAVITTLSHLHLLSAPKHITAYLELGVRTSKYTPRYTTGRARWKKYLTKGSITHNSNFTTYNTLPTSVLRQITASKSPFSRSLPSISTKTTALSAYTSFRLDNRPSYILLNPQLQLIFEENTGQDRRRENLPTVSEVSVLILDDLPPDQYWEFMLAKRNMDGTVQT